MLANELLRLVGSDLIEAGRKPVLFERFAGEGHTVAVRTPSGRFEPVSFRRASFVCHLPDEHIGLSSMDQTSRRVLQPFARMISNTLVKYCPPGSQIVVGLSGDSPGWGCVRVSDPFAGLSLNAELVRDVAAGGPDVLGASIVYGFYGGVSITPLQQWWIDRLLASRAELVSQVERLRMAT